MSDKIKKKIIAKSNLAITKPLAKIKLPEKKYTFIRTTSVSFSWGPHRPQKYENLFFLFPEILVSEIMMNKSFNNNPVITELKKHSKKIHSDFYNVSNLLVGSTQTPERQQIYFCDISE